MRNLAWFGGGLVFVTVAACGGASQTTVGAEGSGGSGSVTSGTGATSSGTGGADNGGTGGVNGGGNGTGGGVVPTGGNAAGGYTATGGYVNTGGLVIGTGGYIPEPDCYTDDDCDDLNDCTIDKCATGSGTCSHTTIVQPHDKCTTGAALIESDGCTTGDQEVIDEVCYEFSSCCTSSWTAACVGYVQSWADNDDCAPANPCDYAGCHAGTCSTCKSEICEIDDVCCSTWDSICASKADAYCGCQ